MIWVREIISLFELKSVRKDENAKSANCEIVIQIAKKTTTEKKRSL